MDIKNEQLFPVEARKIVSDLMFKVLAHSLCVREAIKAFPPDIDDASVQCAWHALVHLEADEDLRKRDPEYSQEQDDYMEMIAFILRDGDALPANIIDSYKKYYEMAPTPKSKSINGWLKSLIRFTI